VSGRSPSPPRRAKLTVLSQIPYRDIMSLFAARERERKREGREGKERKKRDEKDGEKNTPQNKFLVKVFLTMHRK